MSYLPTPEERENGPQFDQARTGQKRVKRKIGLKNWLGPFAAWLKAFSKPYTVPVKQTHRESAKVYRGWHANNLETCTGCGLCHDVCMNNAIDMVMAGETTKKDTGLRPRLDYGRCCWCGLCVDICAAGSLHLSPQYSWIGDTPEDFRYIPGIEHKPWDDLDGGWRQWKKLEKEKAKAAEAKAEAGKK